MPTFKELFEEAKKKPAGQQPDYVYKAVTADQFREIQKTGILQKNRLRTIFHTEHGEARRQEPGGVLIRVKRKGMPGTDTAEDGTHRTKGGVTSGRIEVHHPYAPGGWSPLKRDE